MTSGRQLRSQDHAITVVSQTLAWIHSCATDQRAVCEQCRRSAEVAVHSAAKHAHPSTGATPGRRTR